MLTNLFWYHDTFFNQVLTYWFVFNKSFNMLLETSLNFGLIFDFYFMRGFLDIGLFYLVAWKSVGRHDYKIQFSLFKSSPNQHFFTIFSYLHFPHCVSQPQMIPQVFNQNDRKWLKLLSGNSFRWAGHTFRF